MTASVDLEAMLASLKSDDWSFMDALDQRFGASPETRKKREKAELDQQRLAAAAATVFDGDDGALVMEWILDVTWRRFTFAVASHPDPQQALLYGAFREGQNALAITILRLVAKGRSEPAPPAPE